MLSEKEERISRSAKNYIKKITKTGELFKIFAHPDKFFGQENPITFFMAGSPGAGKTETSKNFIEENGQFNIVRIDADEIRMLCPGYNGQNSHLYQEASALGVNKLYDYINKKKFNALIDGTFASEKYALANVDNALKRKRKVYITYIFQKPLEAWEFTLKRERLENRKITLEVFIRGFMESKNNVQKIKDIHKENVTVDIVVKNGQSKIEKAELNINNIDDHIDFNYTYDYLYDILKDIKI